MGLMEVGWEGVDWMHVTQERDQCPAVVNTATNLLVSYNEVFIHHCI
jgi:hypothetical protein